MHLPLTFKLFDGFFRGYWKYGPIIGKIIENVQLAVHKEIFQQNTYPTTTYCRLCSSEHTCMKILFLVGLFWSRRDLLRK